MCNVTISYHDGDYIKTQFNGTAGQAMDRWPPGTLSNVGQGSYDHYKRITHVLVHGKAGDLWPEIK